MAHQVTESAVAPLGHGQYRVAVALYAHSAFQFSDAVETFEKGGFTTARRTNDRRDTVVGN